MEASALDVSVSTPVFGGFLLFPFPLVQFNWEIWFKRASLQKGRYSLTATRISEEIFTQSIHRNNFSRLSRKKAVYNDLLLYLLRFLHLNHSVIKWTTSQLLLLSFAISIASSRKSQKTEDKSNILNGPYHVLERDLLWNCFDVIVI